MVLGVLNSTLRFSRSASLLSFRVLQPCPAPDMPLGRRSRSGCPGAPFAPSGRPGTPAVTRAPCAPSSHAARSPRRAAPSMHHLLVYLQSPIIVACEKRGGDAPRGTLSRAESFIKAVLLKPPAPLRLNVNRVMRILTLVIFDPILSSFKYITNI